MRRASVAALVGALLFPVLTPAQQPEVATKDVTDGRLQLENYGQEPVRLTTITQETKKEKE